MATSEASSPSVAVFQFRTDPELLKQVKESAARSHVSANRYLVEAVKAKLAQEKEREWREGFEAMGRDPEMDAEYMLPAAHEVVCAE